MPDTPLPRSVRPMLAVSAEPFDAPDYLYELKWDGVRCLAFIDGGVRLQSRNLKILNDRYPELLGLAGAVKAAPCVLDGEIVALRGGKPSFQDLQKRLNAKRPETIRRVAGAIPVVYMIFDLLYVRGEDATRLPFRRRRELLQEALAETDRFILTRQVPERGREYFAAAGRLGLEGVIGKQADSPYLPGRRSRYWVKFRNTKIASFLICGYTESPSSQGMPGALALGAYLDGKLTSFGMVGTGFSQAELSMLRPVLAALETAVCPFTGAGLRMKGFHWTRPALVCDVEYLELTDQGTLRHPLYKGLREDLEPEECTFPPGG